MSDPSSSDPSTAAGERIASLRRAASLSQPELAARAGVSISTVYRAERGDRSLGPRMVARIAAALAVEPGDIHAGDALLRAELPLTAHRAEEQHEELLLGMEARHGEVMQGLERIESAIDRSTG